MFDNFLKLIPTQISTAWLAPVFAIVFACWKFFREQKRLEETVEVEKTKVVKLEAALEQQKRSNELLHQGLLEMQQHKEQLDTLLADARSQIRAVADSIIIRNPYSDQALVFLIAHGPAAQSVIKMQIDLHGSQAGEVYLSRKTSIYSPAMVNKAHEKRLDTKSGFQSNNILTKPLLKFGSELVGVVQFLNEDRTTPFTVEDEKKIEPICVKLALAVSNIIADPINLVHLGVVLDPHINQATILFTDITNSDLLFQQLAVADATALVDEYLERLGAIGVKHGARIDKYLGDGMMLSFETAGAENAPKALRAALEMQREFSEIKQEWQRLNYALDLLDHRIGIASGPVYGRRMGYSGTSIFTIMGAPVNLAAHLCDQARSASERILISEDSEQKLRHAMPSGWYLERFALPRYAAYQVSNNAAGQMAKVVA